MLDYNWIHLSSCPFSISDWLLYSEPVPQRKNTFPLYHFYYCQVKSCFSISKLLYPGLRKGFSALHRWGIHVAQNMKWALDEWCYRWGQCQSCLLQRLSKYGSGALRMAFPRFGVNEVISHPLFWLGSRALTPKPEPCLVRTGAAVGKVCSPGQLTVLLIKG